MSPLDIIEEMNRQFDDAIITTDVGQHMMLVSQYAEITEKKQQKKWEQHKDLEDMDQSKDMNS